MQTVPDLQFTQYMTTHVYENIFPVMSVPIIQTALSKNNKAFRNASNHRN